jgi:molybdate transport system ATP-binding protein
MHLLSRDPATLSGGERQRVGLARALAPRPRLLLCDEPVSALDLDARFALIERLGAIQRAEAIPVLYVTHSPAEAVALGSRLLLLEAGRIRDEGDPLDLLARRGSGWSADGLRNVFPATVAGHDPAGGEAHLRLGEDGPLLIVPYVDRPIGSRLPVAVRADDILLARGPAPGLSARNCLAGVVERILAHNSEAEVVVRTGPVAWLVSVVPSAVAALGLHPGDEVHLIIKARSCRCLIATVPGAAP